MDFANKGFFSLINMFIGIVIFFLIAYVFVRLIPVILIAGIIIWSITKIRSKYKSWSKNRNIIKSNINEKVESFNDSEAFDFNNSEAIDVEYEEINKR